MLPICRSSLRNEVWKFGHVERRPFSAEQVNDIEQVSAWHPAKIPGNVRLDLLALDHIPDPFVDQQYQASQWVDDVDWWYQTTLNLALEPDQRAFVRFWGLDYLSAIFVNGQELTRHEGMFSRQLIELTPYLDQGTCRLAVRLWGGGALPRRQLTWRQRIWQAIAEKLYASWVGVYPDRTATLKTQMAFGWDFAPRILTVGIWDDVECMITGEQFIEACQLAVQPSGEGTLQLTLNSPHPTTVDTARSDIALSISPNNFEAEETLFHFKPTPNSGVQTISCLKSKSQLVNAQVFTFSFSLPEPKLWHPWDRGFPHLYTFQVNAGESDSLQQRFGIRSLAWRDWQLQINGQNTFVRGLNWVPVDSLPGRVEATDYAALITMAKETGANLLRVWGGGFARETGVLRYVRCIRHIGVARISLCLCFFRVFSSREGLSTACSPRNSGDCGPVAPSPSFGLMVRW